MRPPTSTNRGTGNSGPTARANATASAGRPLAQSTRFASESVVIAHSARSEAPVRSDRAPTDAAMTSRSRGPGSRHTVEAVAESTRPSGSTINVTEAGSADDSTTGPSSTRLAEYHHRTPSTASSRVRYRRDASAICEDSHPTSWMSEIGAASTGDHVTDTIR